LTKDDEEEKGRWWWCERAVADVGVEEEKEGECKETVLKKKARTQGGRQVGRRKERPKKKPCKRREK